MGPIISQILLGPLLTPIWFGLEQPNLVWSHIGEEQLSVGQLHPKLGSVGPKHPQNIWDLTA